MQLTSYRFDEVTLNFDRKRIPLSSRQRENRVGGYPYYGAQGIIDYIDGYLFDGLYLLIAEDGENLKSRKQDIAQLASGKFWVNNHAHIIQGNKLCDTEYLYYLINNIDLSGYITGSAQPKLSQNNLNAIQLRLPSIEIQKKIVSYLNVIGKKILVNKEINDNLEQQARILFKSWFIDFNPFSNRMPLDWRNGTINDIIELHDSKRVPISGAERDKMNKIYPYYGATSIMDYVDNYLFDGIYLLLSEDGSVTDTEGYPILQYVEGKFWVNNHAHIITGKKDYSVELLYLLFSFTNLKSIVTGAVQPKISQNNLRKVPIIIPTPKVLKQFDTIIQPIFEQIRLLRTENQQLIQIRDILLPKLISGEIDVSNINI